MSSKTFENFDKFQRKEFADRLTRVITTFSKFYDEAFVLSLDAQFGAGKTTFLEMWKNDLEAHGYQVLYVNAWETDYGEEPLVPIIEAIITELRNSDTDSTTVSLQNALKGALGASALLANQAAEHFTGIDAEGLVNRYHETASQGDLIKIGEELYKSYEFKKNAYHSLREKLEQYAKEIDKPPFIILVDELDRVRPNYAVAFLEAMKHIFSSKGLCFVLAVNREQMHQSLRQLYGEIDFDNYYRRFTTRQVCLPQINNLDLQPFIKQLSQEFFDEKRADGIRYPFPPEKQKRILWFMGLTCSAMNLTARQIESCFRIFSQFMAIEIEQAEARLDAIDAVIFLISLSIKNPDIYHATGQDTVSPQDMGAFIANLHYESTHQNDNKVALARLVFSSMLSENEDNKNVEIADAYLEIDQRLTGKSSADLSEVRRNVIRSLAKKIDHFGDIPQESRLQDIYKRLESWNAFLE